MTIRQLKMLEQFTSHGLSIEEALNLHQTTFGSLCFHKWVVFNPKNERFVCSFSGDEAIRFNQNLNLHRKFNNEKFSVRVIMKSRRRRAA